MKRQSVISIFLLSISLLGCSKTYSAKPITATVVDSKTNQPIGGVVVVAHWELNGGLEGGNFKGNMMVMETITDSRGAFHFPGWGPISKRTDIWGAQIKDEDPEIILFKNGYRPGFFANDNSLELLRQDPEVRISQWDGKAMPLEKYEGDLRGYADHEIDWLSTQLRRTMSSNCVWTKLPLMILALQEQTRVFRSAGIDATTFYSDLLNNEKGFREDGCSVVDFLREHSK